MKQKQKPQRSSMVRDTLSTFGTNAFGSVMGLIASLVILNKMPPFEKGLYNQVQTWGEGFFTCLGFSLNSAIIYYVARYKFKNTKGAIKKLTLGVGIFLIAVSAAILLVMFNATDFFKETPWEYGLCIVIYSGCSFLFNILTAVLRGENKFKSYNMINLIQRILITVFSALTLIWPRAALLTGASIGISMAMIVLAYFCARRWNGAPEEPAPEDDIIVPAKPIFKYGLKAYASNLMTYINSYIGNYIIQGVYDLSTFGIYNTAFTIMRQVWILPEAVGVVITSRVASMKDNNDKVRITQLSCKIVMYITVVCAFLIVWLANIFVPIIFPKYVDSLTPLKFLIIGSIFVSFAKVLSNSISAYGRPELNILPTALGIVVNIIATISLIPLMSYNGVAVATSLSMMVQGICSLIIFCIFTHTNPVWLIVPRKSEVTLVANVFRRK
ncbi:lipopolysaccharide biosynthesis protein [Caproicibacterium amylolyticum]|uniref:Oligosaccharide flippase family protein n=1 Tax=Caproicibacterium amylolyticum TaxID=2766537 RepID=A0A7G9WEQ9_9FIRM|nr:oligosaccharide flippase family protein [Caproicibacterium amylolyticum]QNO17171.1 oligosaccharide flippase family protein [Caproicibacterium amylolyticum]